MVEEKAEEARHGPSSGLARRPAPGALALATCLMVGSLPALAMGAGPSGPGPMGQRSADAHFILMMIPHHEGAIAMADLAMRRACRGEIRALAERIRTSQAGEIEQMRRWYRAWYGSPVPVMRGMASDLEALRTARDFDRAFLEQMVAHHRMGVRMATRAEVATQHPELRRLEAAMARVQSAEIEQMERWYGQWFGAKAL